MSCPPHGAFAKEEDGSNVDKYTICSDRQQQVLRAKIIQGTEIQGWGAFIERWGGQGRPSLDCGIGGKPKECEGTITEMSMTVGELVRGPGRGFLTSWGVGKGVRMMGAGEGLGGSWGEVGGRSPGLAVDWRSWLCHVSALIHPPAHTGLASLSLLCAPSDLRDLLRALWELGSCRVCVCV